MPKLTVEDLMKIKKAHEGTFTLREGDERAKVTVHMGTCGIAAGARDVMQALMDAIKDAGTQDVIVSTSGCAGLCSREPMATVEVKGQAPVKYAGLDPDKMRRIFTEHVKGGQVVEDYALAIGSETSY